MKGPKNTHGEMLTPADVAALFDETAAPICLLSAAQQAKSRTLRTFRRYAKGEVIYAEGEPASHTYLILSGKTKNLRTGLTTSQGNREQITRLCKTGDLLGFHAAAGENLHASTAVALEETVASLMPGDFVRHLTEDNPRIAGYIIGGLVRELTACHRRTLSLTQKQIRGRLADSLLEMRDTFGYAQRNQNDGLRSCPKNCCGKPTGKPDNCRIIDVQMTRKDIATLANMTTANVIRTLSAFADEGIIAVEKRDICVIDEAALEKISAMG